MNDNTQEIVRRVPVTSNRIPFPRDFLEKTVIERFNYVVGKVPELNAVKDMGKAYTYHELNNKTNCLAHELIKINGKFGDQEHAVALVLSPGAEMIIGMLGILKAGCFFTSIDKNLPKIRVSNLLNDSKAKVIITNERHIKLV